MLPILFPEAMAGKQTVKNLRFYWGTACGTRCSFDIKNGKVTHEVGVDAKTGKMLENSVEGAHHD
jgi:hypothetical protein